MSTATLSPPRPRPPSRRAVPPTARADRPAWVRSALAVLLVGTAVLYLWDLSASGYANEYYAAAVQAGTQSLTAWLFGSLDSGNAITVDKPPAALWVMTASARLFGFSSWSLLVPQALMGVGSVALLYGAVRRWAGPVAGLVAGAALALTPAAVLMFRFDNPDALLTLLLVAGGYAVVRAGVPRVGADPAAHPAPAARRGARRRGRRRGVVHRAGGAVARRRPAVHRRLHHQLAARAGAGLQRHRSPARRERQRRRWRSGWVGQRRVRRLGRDHAPVHRRDRAGGVLAVAAALVLLVAGLAVTMQAPRTDRLRAALLLWGGWTLVTGVVGRLTLALAAAVTAAWAFVLLAQSDEAFAWVRWVVLAAGVVAVACLVPAGRLRRVALAGAAAAVLVGLAAPAAYAVTTATTAHSGSIPSVGTSASAMGGGTGGGPGDRGTPPWQTDAAASGSATTGGATTDAAATSGAATTDDVATGGTAAASQGGTPPGGMGGGMGGVTSAELTALLSGTTSTWSAAVSSAQSAAGLELASGTAVMSTGGWSGSDAAVTPAQFQAAVANGEIHYYVGGQGGSSESTSAQIAAWVAANYPATTVGGQTVYDLTA